MDTAGALSHAETTSPLQHFSRGNWCSGYLLFWTWKQLFLWLKHQGVSSQWNKSPQGSSTSSRGAIRASSLEILPSKSGKISICMSLGLMSQDTYGNITFMRVFRGFPPHNWRIWSKPEVKVKTTFWKLEIQMMTCILGQMASRGGSCSTNSNSTCQQPLQPIFSSLQRWVVRLWVKSSNALRQYFIWGIQCEHRYGENHVPFSECRASPSAAGSRTTASAHSSSVFELLVHWFHQHRQKTVGFLMSKTLGRTSY